MLNRTQPSFRIHGVVLILLIGLVGTLAALAESGAKVSEIKIPPRRQHETEAAYQRRVSVAKKACAARLRAKESDLKISPHRQNETEVAHQRRLNMLSTEEQAIVALPFNTTQSVGSLSADRRTYCHGTYGISDIGNLRIAVKDLVFSGSSSSSSIKVGSSLKWYQRLLLSIRPNRGAVTSSRGSTGHGNRRFTHVTGGKLSKTVCTFGGIKFSFVGNRAIFGNKAVSFEKPTTVFLSLEGKLEKIFRGGNVLE